jgi:hypothetical protein
MTEPGPAFAHDPTEAHECFGCHIHIAGGQPHIHVGLDDFMARKTGAEPLGLDDILTFPFCADCTEPSEDGWQLHGHEVPDDPH